MSWSHVDSILCIFSYIIECVARYTWFLRGEVRALVTDVGVNPQMLRSLMLSFLIKLFSRTLVGASLSTKSYALVFFLVCGPDLVDRFGRLKIQVGDQLAHPTSAAGAFVTILLGYAIYGSCPPIILPCFIRSQDYADNPVDGSTWGHSYHINISLYRAPMWRRVPTDSFPFF